MELFGTAGVRGPVTEVTPEVALQVGQALGSLIHEEMYPENAPNLESTVVLARDGRITGQSLLAAFESGLTSAGVRVQRAGQLPTPALAYASIDQYGVMLTASHNPPEDNGIKLFADGQEFDRSGEKLIERRCEEDVQNASWDRWESIQRRDVLENYREAVQLYARTHGDVPTLRIAVDCGNGMASLATPQVLERLGADTVALNANVDGHFTARQSKPTPESLEQFSRFVNGDDATFGIAHDGDADRIVILDDDGEIVHEDTVLAILAEHFTRISDAGDPVVVTTPNASARIDNRVREAGGRIERVRLGALHEGIASVRASGTAKTTVVFAAEPWKHIHPEFGGWIDGVASAAVFARLVAKSGLESLREPIMERPYRKENVRCADEDKSATMRTLAEMLPDAFPEASVDTEYGVRLELPDGSWTLVRPSGTEPYLRIYAESDDVDSFVGDVSRCVERAMGD